MLLQTKLRAVGVVLAEVPISLISQLWRRLSLTAVFVLLVGVSSAQVDSGASVAPGYLFVEFAEPDISVTNGKTGLASFDKVAERFGVEHIKKAFPFLDVIGQHRTLNPEVASLKNVYEVKYNAPYAPKYVARELIRDSGVILAEPQPVHKVTRLHSELPNDPQFSSQAHMEYIGLTEAWDVAKGDQGDVVIAIVDTGIHWQHEDLRENIWTNPNEIANNGIDDDNNGFIDDVHGWNFRTDSPDVYGDGTFARHGTIVAGIAGAVTNNSLGIAGASWNAKIMPINASCETDENLCRTIPGILYAALMGADIVNCSFGSEDYSQIGHRVYLAAFEEGTLAVAASGNSGVNLDEETHYPASYAVTLSVGGIRKTSDQNTFNYGRSVNVFAPSVSINSVFPNNNYGTASGTSMAAPLTSAIAALVKTQFPSFTPGQIREQIRLTAQNIDAAQSIGQPGEFGRGRVDPLRALTETVGPAIRLTAVQFVNQNGSQEASTGDVVTVRAQFKNYLGAASAARIALRTDASFVQFAVDEVSGTNLAFGDSVTHEFSFTIRDGAPDNYNLGFYTEISQGELLDTPDIFRIPINQNLAATHHTAAMRVSITREGNIGYTAFQGDPEAQGIGFRPLDANGNERDPLFEGGLLVATGPGLVSNSIRGVASPGQDDHFEIPDGESMQIAFPGPRTSQQGRLVLTDTKANSPIGVRILQESYVDHEPGYEDVVVFKYTIGNETSELISNLHVGLFFDWDIDLVDVSQDRAGFSGVNSTAWANDAIGGMYVGMRLLTQPELLNYRAIDNPSEIYNGFTPREKWDAMSGGLSRGTLGGTDVSQLMASGPHSIGSGETIEAAFAVIAGTSEQDFLDNADKALELWEHVINAPTAYANVADSTLLADFFNRTHGSLLWHNHTGWLEETVSQWYGITLDASGRVTEVNLPNNNLVGQLPLSQLHQLPNLRRLDVSGNEFSGTIPNGLGELTQLEYLDLSRNTLAGELPKELAGQAPLKVLDLGGNQLVGAIPTELSQISTLQTFSVSANQLSGPVPAFTGLDQLDTLHVAQNAFLFMDLLPNASLTRLDDFVYAPQDSIETLLTSTASGFALTTAAKAVGNRYQWYRDDQPISGPQSDTLQVSATSDPAQYYATITNDRLPDLTLVSRKKGVHDGLTLTEGELPDNFLLHQSYPNPFTEATTVAFELGTPEHVRIVVYDLLGKAVATIADGRFTAGVHRVEFTGDHLASGQYMYRMEAGAYQRMRFMSVIR